MTSKMTIQNPPAAVLQTPFNVNINIACASDWASTQFDTLLDIGIEAGITRRDHDDTSPMRSGPIPGFCRSVSISMLDVLLSGRLKGLVLSHFLLGDQISLQFAFACRSGLHSSLWNGQHICSSATAEASFILRPERELPNHETMVGPSPRVSCLDRCRSSYRTLLLVATHSQGRLGLFNQAES
jgi:hypothetical protein